MARYDDYLKQRTKLEDEIEVAADRSAERQQKANAGFDMPSKFQGKSAEEIARSYIELERLNAQQGHALGETRKLVDDLVTAQLESKRQQPSEPEPGLTIDELYEDPEKAISRVVDKAANKRIEKLENELKQRDYRERFSQFETHFPEWRTVAESDEFKDWAQTSPYRVRLLETVRTTGDVDAAEDLFTMYSDAQGGGGRKRGRPSKRAIMDASLEGPSATPVTTDELVSRSELMEKRIRAKAGNREAINWLRSNAEKIAIAYEEGRVVD